MFIARPDSTAEDDGWLFVVVYDAEHDRSDIVILDAQDLSTDPLATLDLRHHLPYELHGRFTPEVWL